MKGTIGMHQMHIIQSRQKNKGDYKDDYIPGVRTLAGAFTSSFPRIIPEQTSSVYLSFFSRSDPVPRPRISTYLSDGFFDSDLNLLSSNVPSTVTTTFKPFQRIQPHNIQTGVECNPENLQPSSISIGP